VKRALTVFALFSVFLASCSALGYVPQADLDAARAAQAAAEIDRDAAHSYAVELEEVVGDLEDQVERLDGVQADLEAAQRTVTDLQDRAGEAEDQLAALVCSDHDWEEATNTVGVWLVAPSADQVEDSLFVVYDTEWAPPGREPVEGAYWTILLFDKDPSPALILDTRENCVILNPEVWGNEFFR